MQIRVFILDKENKFVETFDKQLINEPIEKIKKLELSPVNEIIESFKESDYPKNEIKVLRWTVLYKNHIVVVSCDKGLLYWLKINNDIICKIRKFDFETISFKFDGNIILPKNKCKNMPFIVGKAAVDYLALEAKELFNFTPILSYNQEYFSNGRTLIDAFFKYPIDVNLLFLNDYLNINNQPFNKIFDTNKDIFEQLCQKFKLESSKRLKEDYEQYPFSLVLTKGLNKLGIKKYENIKKFFNLLTWNGKPIEKASNELNVSAHYSNDITIFYTRLFENPKDVIALTDNGHYHNSWNFYCQYILYKKGEDFLTKVLLDIQNDWQIEKEWFTEKFIAQFHILSNNFLQKVQNSFITKELYQELLQDIENEKIKKCTFSYDKKYYDYQDIIDGFEFNLIKNNDEYFESARSPYENNYRVAFRPASDGFIYYSIKKNEKYIACLILSSSFFIKMIDDFSNNSNEIFVRIAVLKWLKKTGLYKNYGPYNHTDYQYLR